MLDFAIYVRYMPSHRLRRLDKPLLKLKSWFGPYGCLPGIKIPYICIEAATMAQYMGTYPGVGACRYIQYAHLLLYMFSWLFSTPNLEGSTTPNACSGKPVRVMQEAEPVIIGAQLWVLRVRYTWEYLYIHSHPTHKNLHHSEGYRVYQPCSPSRIHNSEKSRIYAQ